MTKEERLRKKAEEKIAAMTHEEILRMQLEEGLRMQLKLIRTGATLLQHMLDGWEASSIEDQAIGEAHMIVRNFPYRSIIDVALALDEAKGEELKIREKVLMDNLKERYPTFEAMNKVFMPMIKDEIKLCENWMQEYGCKVPKWKRPQWLKEMEP